MVARSEIGSVELRIPNTPCYICPALPLSSLPNLSTTSYSPLPVPSLFASKKSRNFEPRQAPESYVRRLARAKADAAWEDRNEIVLGADTIVVLGGVLEPKSSKNLAMPATPATCCAVWQAATHTVITGICCVTAEAWKWTAAPLWCDLRP